MNQLCCPGYGGPKHESGQGTLGPEARQLYRSIEIFAATKGLQAPKILSSCRSLEQQRSLQRRWDAGDRLGLATRPADDSKHVPDELGICHAFDLAGSDAWLTMVGTFVQGSFPNAVWGGSFLPPDKNHFHVNPSAKWISAATWVIG